jgi:hypothetical protein
MASILVHDLHDAWTLDSQSMAKVHGGMSVALISGLASYLASICGGSGTLDPRSANEKAERQFDRSIRQ